MRRKAREILIARERVKLLERRAEFDGSGRISAQLVEARAKLAKLDPPKKKPKVKKAKAKKKEG